MLSTVRVDWLSFTHETEIQTPLPYPVYQRLLFAVLDWLPLLTPFSDVPMAGWGRGVKRIGYSLSYQSADKGVALFADPNKSAVLIEVTGRTCEYLHDRGKMQLLLLLVKDRVTRIDVAVDFLTDVQPLDFAELRDVERFKANGHQISQSGSTYYVGSQKSDRYARVYRYLPPHPRAHLLRCEMVCKKQAAKIAAYSILETSPEATAGSLGAVFGWRHPLWTGADLADEKLPGWTPERRQGKTVRWLITQCIPAALRLEEEGVIEDAEAFLVDHLRQLRSKPILDAMT